MSTPNPSNSPSPPNPSNRPKRYILGVDPGFKGALGIYDPDTKSCVALRDTPLVSGNPKRNQIDLFDLVQWIGLYASDLKLALIERVHAMTYVDKHGEVRGQSAAGSFEFGRTTGIVQGVIAAFDIPTVLVSPASWKASMGLTSNKSESLEMARKLFPSHRQYLLRKKDDGRAEALLLCVFAARYGFGESHGSRRDKETLT